MLNAAFATDTGVENDPIDAKDDGVVWYEVLGVVPEQLKPFDQVKDEVAKDWRSDEVRTRVAKYAQDLVTGLNGGKTLEDVAKDLNVEVLTSDPLKRDGITVNILPPAVAQAFTLPEKGYGVGRRPASRKAASCSRSTRSRRRRRWRQPRPIGSSVQLGLLISEDAIAEYFSALETRYGVIVNQQALAKLIGSGEEP